jgi:DNA-binding transcriptional regulator YiaG
LDKDFEAQREWIERNPIRVYRKEHDITILGFAAYLGVTLSTVQRWEVGGMTPTQSNAERLADMIGVSGAEFWNRWHTWYESRPKS